MSELRNQTDLAEERNNDAKCMQNHVGAWQNKQKNKNASFFSPRVGPGNLFRLFYVPSPASTLVMFTLTDHVSELSLIYHQIRHGTRDLFAQQQDTRVRRQPL